MSGADLRLTLDDGETLAIAAKDVTRVCENLWRLAPREDAVFLFGVVTAESRNPSRRIPLELTASQSAVICQAVAMLDSKP